MTRSGLSSKSARERLMKFGPNTITPVEKVTFFGIAKEEVTEPMILFLLVIGVVYSVWGARGDAITIFSVIAILVFAEVFNEFRAKKAIAALAKISEPKARVIRDGAVAEIDSETVVPGDLLVLTAGTRLAADARVEISRGLQINESALTGESFPVDKMKNDVIFAGTVVVSGEGNAEVSATGSNTRLGHIAATAKTVKQPKTALQLAMKKLTGQLFWLALGVVVLITALGLLRGQSLRLTFLTGLSLAFATIPEEMPIIITMVLGLGVYTLSRHNFLVKRIRAGETLGSVTVIVTDKTGTITEGVLRLASVFPENRGRILANARGALTEFSLSPLDQAIIAVTGGNVDLPPVVRDRNFSDGKKTRAVLRVVSGSLELFVSGAPEEVFAVCAEVPDEGREELRKETGMGRRVIATACRRIPRDQGEAPFDILEKDMEYVGLISFEDPPRPGVAETIADVRHAGIRTVMVTGDHPLTAQSIARQVGIAAEGSKVLSGRDLSSVPDAELKKFVNEVPVFARTTPQDKYRIVTALQADGNVVAVTGDGINDALALRSADIGIAMGVRGTDVAREAAEVVLADDNYITITRGVFEGRKFFDNLRKGVKYYLSVKIALVLTFLLPVIIGMPFPFSPIQIILLEVFMDLAASAGFVAEPAEKDLHSRPPRPRTESILDGKTLADIFIKGTVFFIGVSAVYLFAVSKGYGAASAQSMAFSSWIIGHVLLAFVSRSGHVSLIKMGPFSNRIIDIWGVSAILFLAAALNVPALRERLFLAPLSVGTLALIFLWMFIVIGSLELAKKKISEF